MYGGCLLCPLHPLLVKTSISSTKTTKQQREYLIFTQKLLKINISFITSNDFRRLCPFVFVMPTSKHKYLCFPILVQSVTACAFWRNLCVDCFQYKLSSVWSYIFLLNDPDKKPKQNSSKTKRYSQQQEAKSVRRWTAVSQQTFFRDFALIS